MRTENSIRNAAVSLGGQMISTLLVFATRMVFTRTLEKAYLGASGLFGDILTLLSLSELGVGSAIIFFMYEPVAKGDIEKQKQLMGLYQDLYRKIGIFVAVVGFGLTPFIQFLVGDIPDGFQNVHLIYDLYVLNLVLSYFFSYKRAAIEAHQKNYICMAYQYTLLCLQSLLQIAVLFLTHNFILYLCVQVCTTLLTNILIARKASVMYPDLRHRPDQPLESKEKRHIYQNIKAMFMHRLGSAVVNGTDNILLTIFGGLISTGIYSNYRMIVSTLTQIIGQAFTSITSSIGNLGALEDKKKIYHVFGLLNFVDYWIFSVCTICLGGLLNPFITICFGEDYLFDNWMVLVLLVNFYLSGMRQVVLRFRDALGLFWYDRYKAVAESVVNLVVSIILAHFLGIIGVFLGTMISTLTLAFWIEPYVLYKYGFESSSKPYFIQYIKFTLLWLINSAITLFLVKQVPWGGLGGFVVKAILCLAIADLFLFIVFFRTEEFKYFKNLIKQKIRRKHFPDN